MNNRLLQNYADLYGHEWEGLVDYYLMKYSQMKEHDTYGLVIAGILCGLGWICQYYGITDDDLGEDRAAKIRC